MSRECTEPQKPRGGGRGRGGDRGGRGGHDGPVSFHLWSSNDPSADYVEGGTILTLSQPGEVLQLPGVGPHVQGMHRTPEASRRW